MDTTTTPIQQIMRFWLRPSSSANGIFCPSVRLSHLFYYVPIIVLSGNFQELLLMTTVRTMQKCQGQSSKVKVTEVKAQLNSFRTVTPVWIHIWWWNDAQSLMLLRSVKFHGHTSKKIVDFDPNWAFPDSNSSLNIFKAIRQISRSHGRKKNRRFWPELSASGL